VLAQGTLKTVNSYQIPILTFNERGSLLPSGGRRRVRLVL
jgi:hypothetical protein